MIGSQIHWLRLKYLEQIYRERLSKLAPPEDAPEVETDNSNIRFIYVYNPNNPYLMFLVFILLMMSFNPPYQVVAYQLPQSFATV